MYDNFSSKFAGIIANVLIALMGGIIGSLITIYVDKYVDWEMSTSKYFETAYYEAKFVKETFEETVPKNSVLPVQKLLNDNPDWNDIIFKSQDEKIAKTYFKLRYLDDLRDKAFQSNLAIDKQLINTEYWKIFNEIKSSSELEYFIERLNYYRFSSEKERRLEQQIKYQEELKRLQENSSK